MLNDVNTQIREMQERIDANQEQLQRTTKENQLLKKEVSKERSELEGLRFNERVKADYEQ